MYASDILNGEIKTRLNIVVIETLYLENVVRKPRALSEIEPGTLEYKAVTLASTS